METVATYDETIFELAKSSGAGASEVSPFVQKTLLNIPDTNPSGNYSTNQIIFEMNSLANNGKWLDHKNGFFAIPFVLQLNGKGAAATSFANNASGATANTVANDFAVWLKNSNLNLINSVTIDVGNQQVVSRVDNINQYLLFKEHTETNEMDEAMQVHYGYAKDTSTSWSYVPPTAPTGVGVGLCNNSSGYNSALRSMSMVSDGDLYNEGMCERAKNAFVCAGSNTYGKSLILGDDTRIEQMYRATNKNYVSNTANAKYIFYTALIPCRKLPLFNSDFPTLLRSTYLKVTFNINQCFFEFTKATDGSLTFSNSTQMLSGASCPLMVASTYKPYTAVQGTAQATVAASTSQLPCGSAGLPVTITYQCSLSILQTRYTHAYGAPQRHQMSSPRYYCNAYSMNAEAEKLYLSLGQKRVGFTNVTCIPFYNVSQSFSLNVTSGIPRARRMIIMPFLSASSNATEGGAAGFSELASPFSTAPATLAPYSISNFQVLLGGVPLYSQPLNYFYENFVSEMSEHELYNGRINFTDWMNLYGYMVVDLKRRLPIDANTLQQITISGTLQSLKAVDLYVWVESSDSIVFDLASGQTIAA